MGTPSSLFMLNPLLNCALLAIALPAGLAWGAAPGAAPTWLQDAVALRYRPGAELDVDSSGQVPVYGLAPAGNSQACPSVFVLRPDGTVRWRFVSEHEELRLTVGSILQRSVGQLADQTRTPVAEAGRVHLEITASDTSASLGSRLIQFQACTDRECFPPQSVPLQWSFAFTPPDRERVPIEHWRAFEH